MQEYEHREYNIVAGTGETKMQETKTNGTRQEFTETLIEFAKRIAEVRTQKDKKRIIAERDYYIRTRGK
jgi:hypothetical protein